MSHVIICREALEDSVLGSFALARAFSNRDEAIAIVFTGEALSALDKGTFEWSRNFKTRVAQAAIVATAEESGLPLAHRELDSRWSDIRGFVASMKEHQGMQLIACPIWCGLLGIDKGLDYLERLSEEQLVDLLKAADTVIGGY
ncbi:MAG: hypothetical protein CMQ19_01275 [Gammaproteobacteria bacterium]|jgi:peroxiredoxin family protein|nr:hypothetical protein [Gammaproteobacteria bacterium]|tara:strand:+ start:461 stop:892 length:432 start_codon:yes stop_codon:yes gene_type:complete